MISNSIGSTPHTSELTINSDGIDKKHRQEWLNSCVDEKIISRNVISIHDAREVDKALDRNTKKRWKHSNDLVPCWQVSGLDPFTGERTLLGTQIKPDTSIFTKDGKPQKYLGASGYGTYPLFLDNGTEGYWKSIIDDKSQPVIITEGAKKAGAGLSLGYATISIPGVSTCKKKGRLHSWLNTLAGFGRTFYLCFDNDIVLKRPVQDAMLSMARELCATGAKVMVIELPSGSSKGMDDFIANNGPEEFKELVANAKTIEEWRQMLEEVWQQQKGEERNSKIANYVDIVKAGWGDALRMNQLKNCIELHDQLLDINKVRLRISLEFDTDVPIGDSQMIVEMLAEENAYSPVVEYLENLANQYPDIDTSVLDNLATRFFGTEDPLHNIYMKKTLIAAVARAKRPGCKHDTATILVGKQGWFKSTFWQELYGEDWFCDELGDANERDELMKLHRFWCLEWSEFENVYKRKDVSALKKFMTSRIDAFRAPYDRNVKEHPRRCVLVGTTNEQEILTDPTGSRRFWIIPVQGAIPVGLATQERDLLWAAANALYEKGHQWWLTPDESARQEELNREFQTVDPWTDSIQKYLAGRNFITLSEIFSMLSIEPARQDMQSTKRVTSILRRLDWQAGRKQVAGELQRGWIFNQNEKNSLGILDGSPGSPQEHVAFNACASPGTHKLNFENSPAHVTGCENHQGCVFDQNEKNSLGNLGGSPGSPLSQASNTTDIYDGITELSVSHITELPGDPGDPPELPKLFFQKVQVAEHDTLQKHDTPPDVFNESAQPADEPQQVSNSTLIDFEVGAIFWSVALQKKVKIVKMFKTLPEADVHVSGEIETVRVKLADLALLSASPHTPSSDGGHEAAITVHDRLVALNEKLSTSGKSNQIDQDAIAPGDEVVPLVGPHKKKMLTVTTVNEAGIWAKDKKQGFSPAVGPFQSHQLKKRSGGE